MRNLPPFPHGKSHQGLRKSRAPSAAWHRTRPPNHHHPQPDRERPAALRHLFQPPFALPEEGRQQDRQVGLLKRMIHSSFTSSFTWHSPATMSPTVLLSRAGPVI